MKKTVELSDEQREAISAWWERLLEVLDGAGPLGVSYVLKIKDVSGGSAEVKSPPPSLRGMP